jgi:two-component system osmolarity sensor histidine kinase EnvZ
MTRSLASQNARLLVGVFLIFELLVASAVVVFLMLPMARSSAADLASLMLLSAQTWSELPPETRPAFEHELAATHQLALRAEPPAYDRDEWHGPYLHFVEASLAARTGRLRHLAREEIGGRRGCGSPCPPASTASRWVFP